MNVFIGADIGTTGVRAGVYGEDFSLLGTGEGKSIIRRGRIGELYQDTDEIYTETAAAVRAALESAGVRETAVSAISFDGQMAGVIGIDESWNAVTPYDSWLDTRCSDQVSRIKRRAYDLVIERTGNIPSYNHGPKILWWKEMEPGLYKNIARFIQPGAYVAGRLCGLNAAEAFIDWTYLHFSGFARNRDLAWDEELLGMFDVDRQKFPRIVSPTTVVGRVDKEGAALFGVPEGTPVAAGCGDTASCFLGTGALKKGIAVDVAGTASVFALTTESFLTDRSGLVYCSRSVIEDLWYSMSYINGGGLNLEWFKDTFARDTSFEEMNRAIEDIPPGSNGLIFIPHLEGRGYPYEPHMRGQWHGFTRDHTRAHFYRSILEGIAYEYSLYKEKILGILGGGLHYSVRGVGGGAKSRIWNRIKADVLGCSYCTINREDTGILGQAMIAAAAVGHVEDLRSTAEKIIHKEDEIRPNADSVREYAACIERYKSHLAASG
jgi:xylulokinase